MPVIAGAGSNSTEEAVFLTQFAKDAGADGALIVTPYYNKPSQEGLYSHFKTIADTVDIPIIIYNIPPRSVVDMSVETMARLASDCPNIVGVKDATQDLVRPLDTRAVIGDKFCLLSGEDATVLSYLVNGGDFKEAMTINERLYPLHDSLFVEPNPVPSKFGLSLLNKSTMDVRLPLTPANENTRKTVQAAMISAGILN